MEDSTSTTPRWQFVFDALLKEISSEEKIYVEMMDGSMREVCKIEDITRFALNVILVLEGVRLAYRADVPTLSVNKTLIDMSIALSGVLTIVPTTHTKYLEPLLYLKTREKEIEHLLKTLSDSEDPLGKVLQYSYYGNDWVDREGSHKVVSLTVEHIQTKKQYNLYGFNVPIDKYTEEIRKDVLETVRRYNSVLPQYGYQCYAIKYDHKTWNEERIE